ncbi:TPA: xanthine permease XanP, partial [Klebsiella pneumoniae]|nr:xanthine permease XanP [Klebsiella pneumoniae]
SRRDVLIVGLAFGAGLGVESVPAFLSHFPPMVGDLFGSAATSGGLVAIALNLILPQEQAATKSLRSQDDRAESV